MQVDMREVASGVFLVRASHTNVVLLAEGDALTLVDAGYPSDRRLLQAAVHRLGRQMSDVVALLLTHAHVDHLGCARRLALPVHCHEAEESHARGEVEQVVGARDVLPRLWRPGVLRWFVNVVTHGGLRRTPVDDVQTFDDGDPLDMPGRPVPVHTPGHTSGHVSFHVPEAGALLSGDALVTVDVWRTTRRGPQVLRAPFNHDHDAALASLERFVPLDADVVVPGHGQPFRGTPAEAVASARQRGPRPR